MNSLNGILRRSAIPAPEGGGSFVGEAGKRQEFKLTCVGVVDLQECYSEKIYKFVDEDGNVFINFAGKAGEWFVGEKYKIRATVKAHKIYAETKQTIINRLKTLELFYEKPTEAQGCGAVGWDSI
jgi:hypothetical protein